jgi:hypothetical protein
MDKVRSGTNSASMCIRWLVREPQIPPLRYAPVGMTIHILQADTSAQEKSSSQKVTTSEG